MAHRLLVLAASLAFAASLALLPATAAGDGGPAHVRGGPPRAAACPRGTAPVPGLPVCIDRYEASVEGGRARSRPAVPPATQVTFAEAQTACQAAGKRLCRDEEWVAACRGVSRQWHFPYGEHYEAERCFGWERSQRRKATGPTKTGTHPRCATPEGVLDLSGNAWEWVEGSQGKAPLLRGGGYANAGMDMACTSRDAPDASFRSHTTGFRCCVDLAIPAPKQPPAPAPPPRASR